MSIGPIEVLYLPKKFIPPKQISGYIPVPPLSTSLHFPSLSLEVGPLNPARSLGSAVNFCSAWGLGRNHVQGKANLVHLALKSDIWWHQFYKFSRELILTTTTIQAN